MFSDSIRHLLTVFKKKKLFFLIKSEETYNPVTGDTNIVEIESTIFLIEVSIDTSNLPENCLSSDHKYILIVDNIDKTDKFEDSTGLTYIIKYVKQISSFPSIYEVIIRVN